MSDRITRLNPQQRFYNSTKLGNSIELGPDDLNPVRILEPNIAELDRARNYEAGAWVLTCSTVVRAPSPLVTPVFNPLLARVSFGDGSASTIVELDVAQGSSIQFPCGALQVDIIQQLPPAGFVLPASQKVTATVHRGFSSAAGTRSFAIANSTAAPVVFTGPVPTGAKGMRGFGAGLTDAAHGGIGGGTLALLPVVNAPVLIVYADTDIGSADADGQYLGVPGLAGQWRATVPASPAPPAPSLSIVEFLIQF